MIHSRLLTSRFLWWMGGVGIWLFSTGCNYNVACDEGYDKIECYYYQNGSLISFPYCSNVPPPCDCLDSNGQLRDLAALFEQPCSLCTSDLSYCDQDGGANEPEISEPYLINKCNSQAINTVCTEFDRYVMDFSEGTLDQNDRPIYVEFVLADYNLNDYYYEFAVENTDTGNPIFLDYLRKNDIDVNLIRRLAPETCEVNCVKSGVAKLNIRNAISNGTYRAVVYQVDAASGTNRIKLAEDNFNIESTDPFNFFYDSRVFKLYTFTHNEQDLSTYTLANRSYQQSLDFVFGAGAANIRIENTTKEIPFWFIDEDGDLMLDIYDLDLISNPDDPDISGAVRAWRDRLYDFDNDLNAEIYNDGAIVDVNFMKAYEDFTTGREVSPLNPDFRVAAEELQRSHGTSYMTNPTKRLLSIIYRFNLIRFEDEFLDANYDLDVMSLRTALHEIGHLWAPNATQSLGDVVGSDCFSHSDKGKGDNNLICLWQTTCAESSFNGLSINEYVRLSMATPTFCEGHQQFFMNQLKPTN